MCGRSKKTNLICKILGHKDREEHLEDGVATATVCDRCGRSKLLLRGGGQTVEFSTVGD